MFEFLQQRTVNVDKFEQRKKEIQIKLGRFSSSFLIQRIFEIKGHGRVFGGKVLRGKIQAGQQAYYSGSWGKLEAIEEFKKAVLEAGEGKTVAIKVSGISAPVERGSMLHFK